MQRGAWWFGVVAVGGFMTSSGAPAQPSVGRGALDPLPPMVIVGSEGKGVLPEPMGPAPAVPTGER